jgi:hypothetical protein
MGREFMNLVLIKMYKLKLPDSEKEMYPEIWMGLNMWDNCQIWIQYHYTKFPSGESGYNIFLNKNGLEADVPVEWVIQIN